LLRLVNRQDVQHESVREAVNTLIIGAQELFTTNQNIAEFWNVATRPPQDNGYGLSPEQVAQHLNELIGPICAILVEHESLYDELKRLGLLYKVVGKQVHDARLVAIMRCWQIDSVLTLNDRDFRRYADEGITVVTPSSLAPNASKKAEDRRPGRKPNGRAGNQRLAVLQPGREAGLFWRRDTANQSRRFLYRTPAINSAAPRSTVAGTGFFPDRGSASARRRRCGVRRNTATDKAIWSPRLEWPPSSGRRRL
jgi:predicted nucleic acid-binding protein